ncbi:MAG: hypothetical protein PVG20_09855 [Thioalkalispiraceae bacterium]|jgi:hypothetical protein
MKMRVVLLGTFLLLISQSAQAELDFLGQIGLHGGGDNIVTALFTDGSSEDIKAGEFLSIDLGMAWDMGILEGRITGGWKYDTITASNGDLDFTRYTSQALLLFAAGDWRFGGGAAYHFGIKLDGSGVASGADANYDNALGYVAEIDYYFSEQAYFGIQYLNIEYDRNTDFGQTAATFDGSSVGIVFAGRW